MSVKSDRHASLTVRDVRVEDIKIGLLDLYLHLNPTPISKTRAAEIIQGFIRDPNYYLVVAEETGPGDGPRIVGAATLFVEQKLIHDGGRVGHVEDVVVTPSKQGMGIARMLTERLFEYSRKNRCYKTIADCDDSLQEYNERLGYHRAGICVRIDH